MKKIIMRVFAGLVCCFVFYSCSGSKQQGGQYYNKTLVLAEMDSVKYASNETSGEIFIRLNTESGSKGKIFGFGGCNDIHGTYTISGRGLPEFKLEMTDKSCEKSDIERRLVLLLLNLDSAKYNSGRVQFYSAKLNRTAWFAVKE
jgi:heat shock protein HslJ